MSQKLNFVQNIILNFMIILDLSLIIVRNIIIIIFLINRLALKL